MESKEITKEMKLTTLFLLLALILAFGAYNTLGEGLNTDSPLVSVVSDSMVPAFYKGDILLVRGVSFEDIETGDVVVYDVEGRPIPTIHRVIEKRNSSVETKGDNNRRQLDYEKNVTAEQIRGVAVARLPLLGYVKLIPYQILQSVS